MDRIVDTKQNDVWEGLPSPSREIISVGASLILMPIEFSRDNHGRARNSSTELGTVTTIGAAKSVARKWARNLLVL